MATNTQLAATRHCPNQLPLSDTSARRPARRPIRSCGSLPSTTTSPKELHRAFDSLPCVVPTSHVSGVKTSLSQRGRTLAPNVEAVYTECDHGLVLRKTCHPFFYALRITPDRPVDDVLRSSAVVARPRIDDLYSLPGAKHLLNLFGGDGWHVLEFWLVERSGPGDCHGVGVPRLDRLPVNVAHEGSDVRRRIRSVLNVISVLVHVQSKNRNTPGNALCVIRGTVIDEPTVARDKGHQYPASVTCQCLCQGHEFVTPAIDGPEITSKSARYCVRYVPPIPTQTREIQFMKQS